LVEDIRFIRPPQPFLWETYIPHVVGTVLGLATCYIAFLLIRRRIRNGPSPKTRALRTLRKAARRRIEGGEYWYLLRTNRILRDFFQGTFGLDASAQTSEQLVGSLEHVSILKDDERAWLESYLKECDRIRYAGENRTADTLGHFEQRATPLIKRLHRQKRKLRKASYEPPPEPSPFLPGTPHPVFSENDDFLESSTQEDDPVEAPV